MNVRSAVFVKALLQHFHSSRMDKLIVFFPEEARDLLRKIPPLQKNTQLHLPSEEDYMAYIHYSWFKEYLTLEKTETHEPFVSCLQEPGKGKLAALMGIALSEGKPINLWKTFLFDHYYDKWFGSNAGVLPITLLPDSPMNVLLHMDKNQIVEIIDLLSIYDLTNELRFVLNKSILKKISKSLSENQKEFLIQCQKKQDKLVTRDAPLFDEGRDFKAQLHERGLLRFSGAICQESSSFLWHMCHHLDTGRGKIIEKHLKKVPPLESIQEHLKKQILEIISFQYS